MRLTDDDLSTRVEKSTGGVLSRTLEGFPTSSAKATRRAMFRFATQLASGLFVASRGNASTLLPHRRSSDVRRMVRFPEKRELILLTDRPPQLETPLHYFRQDLTPNEAFFVRWHVAGIPTHVDTRVFRLQVDGHVQRSLSLSCLHASLDGRGGWLARRGIAVVQRARAAARAPPRCMRNSAAP